MSSSDAPGIVLPATAGPDRHPVRFGFENTYTRLPERFYSRLDPTPVADPCLVKVNVELAHSLGLDPDALQARKAWRSWPAITWPRGRSLWQSPMPGTS